MQLFQQGRSGLHADIVARKDHRALHLGAFGVEQGNRQFEARLNRPTRLGLAQRARQQPVQGGFLNQRQNLSRAALAFGRHIQHRLVQQVCNVSLSGGELQPAKGVCRAC